MKTFVGFQIQSGDIVNKDTGEVTKWSNCFLRTTSDEGLLVGEYGQKIGEVKIKTEFLASTIGVVGFDYSPAKITEVIQSLQKLFNKKIDFILTVYRGEYIVSGIKVIN